MKEKKLLIARIILTVLTVAAVVAIFYNSSLDADESSEQSNFILVAINRLLCSLGIQAEITMHFVRKAAHFTEYTVLGTLLSTTVYLYCHKRRRLLPVTVPAGAAVAVCDELIQLIPAGRSCQVTDVLIDTGGILFGALIVFLIISIKEKRRYKMTKEG